MRHRSRAGLTLLELLVAGAIMSIVIAITLAMMLATQETYNRTAFLVDLESRAMVELGEISDDLRYGVNVNIPGDGQRLTYQIPVDYEPDGDVLDNAGNTEYGYNLLGVVPVGNDPLGWSVSFEWVPLMHGPDGIEATADDIPVAGLSYSGPDGLIGTPDDIPAAPINEAVDQFDYNGDGDSIDVFIVGRIDKVVYDDVPAQVAAGAANEMIRFPGTEGVIQVGPAPGVLGDIDGNGNDPVFTLAGTTVSIRFFLLGAAPDGHVHIRDVSVNIILRNVGLP